MVAVFLLSVVTTSKAVLRGKEIKGAFSPWAPASTINGVEEQHLWSLFLRLLSVNSYNTDYRYSLADKSFRL